MTFQMDFHLMVKVQRAESGQGFNQMAHHISMSRSSWKVIHLDVVSLECRVIVPKPIKFHVQWLTVVQSENYEKRKIFHFKCYKHNNSCNISML